MLDRKALADSLHALHSSEIKAGKDGEILKDAIREIIEAIGATKSGLSESDGRHLAEAIGALADGHHFLARSSVLLVLEGAEAPDGPGHAAPLTLTQLRDELNLVRV